MGGRKKHSACGGYSSVQVGTVQRENWESKAERNQTIQKKKNITKLFDGISIFWKITVRYHPSIVKTCVFYLFFVFSVKAALDIRKDDNGVKEGKVFFSKGKMNNNNNYFNSNIRQCLATWTLWSIEGMFTVFYLF